MGAPARGIERLAFELTGRSLIHYTMKDLQSEQLKTRIYFRCLKFQSSCGKFVGYLEKNFEDKYWLVCFKVYVVLWTKKKSQLDCV